MKKGISLTQLAQQIEAQQNLAKDFVADTRHLTMATNTINNSNELIIADSDFRIQGFAHGQIAAETGIPKKYYDMMPAELRATNVNHWWHNGDKERKRLIRTLDGVVRADLSNRYRMVDNVDIAEACLPVLFDRPDLEVLSCELTHRRMYIKVGFKNMLKELAPGDVVQSGVVISNSEVGAGSIEVMPYLNRLWCSNGCYNTEFGQRRNHIGKALGVDSEQAYQFYRDETLQLEDQALMSKLQDTVRACIDETAFSTMTKRFAETMEIKMEADPVTVVERVKKKFSFTEGESSSVLQNLINNADLEGNRNNAFGIINAITRTAQDVDCYDRASELEKLGGNLINLPATEWRKLGEAA